MTVLDCFTVIDWRWRQNKDKDEIPNYAVLLTTSVKRFGVSRMRDFYFKESQKVDDKLHNTFGKLFGDAHIVFSNLVILMLTSEITQFRYPSVQRLLKYIKLKNKRATFVIFFFFNIWIICRYLRRFFLCISFSDEKKEEEFREFILPGVCFEGFIHTETPTQICVY